LAACRKDKDTEPQDLDYTAASDNARAQDAFDDMMAVVDQAASDEGLRDDLDGCNPTVTWDTLVMPHTMDIDFGDVNCTANNGRLRRGVIHVTFTGAYRHPGTVITITPQNYYVNNHHVEGTKTITNMGENPDGHLYYNIVVDGTITAADNSWTHTHHAERVRTWIEGSSTATWLDDVYLITGNGEGVNRNGVHYTTQITNPLRIELNCLWRVVQGTVVVTPDNRPARTIDYGNGSCDGTFTITVNGTTFTVTIG
jgi:hypothetical protein